MAVTQERFIQMANERGLEAEHTVVEKKIYDYHDGEKACKIDAIDVKRGKDVLTTYQVAVIASEFCTEESIAKELDILARNSMAMITLSREFFEHLLNCMCNQKYLPTLDRPMSDREKETQKVIDVAYHQA